MKGIEIIEYETCHQVYFEKFNRDWIEEMFVMEAVDEWVLTNPEEAIIRPGGAILMASYGDTIAGTVGLRKAGEKIFEFTKMAVDKNFRRLGIAEAISYASFYKAKELGAEKIILYSNRKNAGAIKLYEKIGFNHVEVEKGVYERANVKMEIDIETAVSNADRFNKISESSKTMQYGISS
ncbi:MAG TPA: GNAT family N-acetyltransferase [Chitinophagaceae bacterium]|nr:GNAT family N-acetyltransferase [Chitinophagaceae bacterium]